MNACRLAQRSIRSTGVAPAPSMVATAQQKRSHLSAATVAAVPAAAANLGSAYTTYSMTASEWRAVAERVAGAPRLLAGAPTVARSRAPESVFEQSPRWHFPRYAEHAWTFDYEIKQSKVAGLGSFAREPIRKGTVVWRRTAALMTMSPQEVTLMFSSIPAAVANNLLSYCYVWNNRINFNCDDSKYSNHSKNNNIGTVMHGEHRGCLYALRDIEVGEEMTECYIEYEEPEWYVALCDKYDSIPSVQFGNMYD